jgi:hypothetical protein
MKVPYICLTPSHEDVEMEVSGQLLAKATFASG